MRYIILEDPLVVVWMYAQLDAAKTSPLCECQLRLLEHQDNDENYESLLVGTPVALRPDKYVKPWSDFDQIDRDLCYVHVWSHEAY